MAIQNPNISTSIQTPEGGPNPTEMALKALLLGIQGGQQSADRRQATDLAIEEAKTKQGMNLQTLTDLIKGVGPGLGEEGPREKPLVGPGVPINVTDSGISVHPVDRSMQREAAAQRMQNQRNAVLGQTQALLESARGNPEVGQALKDRYSASKALELVTKQDPDKMNPQQVQLLVNEVSKIATGGVPTSAEMQALNPSTLAEKFAGVSQKLLNEPTAANAGAFVKQYRSYLEDLQGNANKVIKNRVGRVIETRRGALGDDYYNTLKTQYLDNAEVPAETKTPVAEPRSNPAASLTQMLKGASQDNSPQKPLSKEEWLAAKKAGKL